MILKISLYFRNLKIFLLLTLCQDKQKDKIQGGLENFEHIIKVYTYEAKDMLFFFLVKHGVRIQLTLWPPLLPF